MPRSRESKNVYLRKSEEKSLPPSPTIQNRSSSFGSLVLDGFAWGTGVSVAKNIFSSDEKEKVINDVSKNIDKKIINEKNVDDMWKKYNECMEKSSQNNYNDCQKILEMK